MMVVKVAFGLYLLNLGVGVGAQFAGMRFGWTHHALYFAVFASAIAAAVWTLHPLLCITLSALAYMPLSRPGSWRHPTAALVGLAGYLGFFYFS